MKQITVRLDDVSDEVLKVASQNGIDKSEFTRRALKLATVVAEVEGVGTLPEDGSTKKDLKQWVRDRYPPNQWPEEASE